MNAHRIVSSSVQCMIQCAGETRPSAQIILTNHLRNAHTRLSCSSNSQNVRAIDGLFRERLNRTNRRKPVGKKQMEENTRIVAINSDNVDDRVRLCWGHLRNWKRLKIVQKSKEWLERTNRSFTPTTLIAYVEGEPVGMVEFVPQKLIEQVGLCPCRADPEKEKIESRYILGKEFEDCLFVSCLWVIKDHQGKGVGKALLNCFLSGEAFKNSSGALVYVARRDERWDKHIHWPAGPKEFYLNAGFTIIKTLDKPVGHLLYYPKKTQTRKRT
jgi:GNAT superfamily N-acetyltransferase